MQPGHRFHVCCRLLETTKTFAFYIKDAHRAEVTVIVARTLEQEINQRAESLKAIWPGTHVFGVVFMASRMDTPKSFVSDVSGSELSTARARWHKIVSLSESFNFCRE